MALTRKLLAALGLEQDKIDEIIAAHTETVDALKRERDGYKEDAGKYAEAQAEIQRLKKAAEDSDSKNPWKLKYDTLKKDFESYKTEQTAKETSAKKSAAYKSLLKEAGVLDKRTDAVLRVSSPAIEAMELDDQGNPKDRDTLLQAIKAEWADFIGTDGTAGAHTPNPPANNGKALKSREDIYKRDDSGRFVMDASERQAALAQIIAAESQQKG